MEEGIAVRPDRQEGETPVLHWIWSDNFLIYDNEIGITIVSGIKIEGDRVNLNLINDIVLKLAKENIKGIQVIRTLFKEENIDNDNWDISKDNIKLVNEWWIDVVGYLESIIL